MDLGLKRKMLKFGDKCNTRSMGYPEFVIVDLWKRIGTLELSIMKDVGTSSPPKSSKRWITRKKTRGEKVGDRGDVGHQLRFLGASSSGAPHQSFKRETYQLDQGKLRKCYQRDSAAKAKRNVIPSRSSPEDAQLATVFTHPHHKFNTTLKSLESFQAKNSERVFNTVMTYIPQDFRGRLIRLQRERSKRNGSNLRGISKLAEIDSMISYGASIRDRYALLWKQQMERRRLLAQLVSATSVYKTLVKYLVGVPQVLLDFVRQINDDDGPMEKQRQRYGPPLYSLTTLVLLIRLAILLSQGRFETRKLNKQEVAVLEQSVDVYTTEFERICIFFSEVFANSPFFISAEVAGLIVNFSRNNDDYKETNVPAGKTHGVSLFVDSINLYIAWDFSLVQGKINLVSFLNFI
ncbi:uncharacterized protein LOC112184667 [Rosa chinensis]|uniref:uncharacterized protein LOC112184667 n=1 Tax=Rosa chinensis TaxID=74649 RepID=UPI001AD8B383|nr:uncharacterized protein LOC112184667 [Rosa chinensis]